MNVRSGEVIFKIETLPHPVFERSNNDLKTTVKITLKQALLGFERVLTHLDGRKIKLTRTKITKPGEVEKIRGEGMPIYEVSSEKGDLVVTYQVEMPAKLSQDQRDSMIKNLTLTLTYSDEKCILDDIIMNTIVLFLSLIL